MLFNFSDFYLKEYSVINGNILPTLLKEEEWFKHIEPYIDDYISDSYYDYDFLGKIARKSMQHEKEALLMIHNNVKNIFIKNNYKYKTLYNTSILEYNPIWNVDGTEELTYEKERANTGTQKNDGSNNLTDEYNSTNTNSNKIEDGRTTFNSSVVAKTNESSENGTLKRTGNDKHNTTINNTRTDNLKEEEKYTEVKKRGGNIGVTMTQQLIQAEREVADFAFIDIVAKDIISSICCLIN